MRILIFGDSIAQGYYDTELGGWVNLLLLDVLKRKERHTDSPTELFNLAVSGDTTKRVAARLQQEVIVRKWADEPVMLVLAVGVNDTLLDNGKPLSSPEEYRQDLEKVYRLAKEVGDQLLFVGLTTVDEAETTPWKFNTGTHDLTWRNERIAQFDATLKAFAKEKQAEYVPIFEEYTKRQARGEQLLADGLHPNAVGHRVIYEQ